MAWLKKSIGAKIFAAFIAMGLIITALGLGGYGVLSAAGRMVVTTFDGTLMAINYARAADADFIRMQKAQAQLAAMPPSARTGIVTRLNEASGTFSDDLDVAEERSLAADEKTIIREIRPLVRQWLTARAQGDPARLAALDAKIDNRFDLLIELNTDHSFVERRKAIWDIAYYKYASIGATIFALMLAGGITLFLRRRIIRPLSAAAAVADRIAGGELETKIPAGGDDETGVLLRSMTVMQDNIRERMAREMAQRQSAESRLVDALETSREGVMLVAPDGTLLLVNGRLRDFFPDLDGRLKTGTTFTEALQLIHTQLAPGSLGDGRIDTTGYAELELVGGRWIRMTASATSEGGSIVFLSEFTAFKEREENYKRAKLEAEAANAAKTRFLANMSHELRTPLNAIIGFSEIITGQLFGEIGNSRYVEYSSDILRSGLHLLDVINSVLDLAKNEAGKMRLVAKPVALNFVLQDCIKMIRAQCVEAQLDLIVSGIETSLPVCGDMAKLRQIFLNLLSNAVKFTECGSVSLIATQKEEIVSVTIVDTGIGMSPQDIEVALEPFGQVDNRLERRYEGTGLGLPLTKAFVDLHGATMDIESAPGTGTRITVTFPPPAELVSDHQSPVHAGAVGFGA